MFYSGFENKTKKERETSQNFLTNVEVRTRKMKREREIESREKKKWKSFDGLIYQPNNVYFDVIRNFPQDIITVATVVIWSHIYISRWGGPQHNKFLSFSFSFGFFFFRSFFFRFSFLRCFHLNAAQSLVFFRTIFSMLYTQSTRRLSILFTCVYNFNMHKRIRKRVLGRMRANALNCARHRWADVPMVIIFASQ